MAPSHQILMKLRSKFPMNGSILSIAHLITSYKRNKIYNFSHTLCVIKMTEYEKLNSELSEAGVPNHVFMGEIEPPINTLVNTKFSSQPYQGILIKYLPVLSKMQLEMVVRALSEKGNKEAVPHLLKLFDRRSELSENNFWAVGNALYIINDKNSYSTILELCKDRSLGIGRCKLLGFLPRIKTEEAYEILIEALKDSQVKGFAIEALGRFGNPEALKILEATEVEKGKYEFKAKATAIKRLTKVKNAS